MPYDVRGSLGNEARTAALKSTASLRLAIAFKKERGREKMGRDREREKKREKQFFPKIPNVERINFRL